MPAPNPERGEAEVGGRKIVIDFNALCALEKATGYRVPDLLQMADTGLGFDELRTWLGVFLIEPMEPDDVGLLLDEVGYEAGLNAITSAMEGFFARQKAKEKRPLKAA